MWLYDTSEISGDNLNNTERDVSGHFRNRKREYQKGKINGHAMNSKNKNIRDLYRGIIEFKRGYQSRSNLVKDENGDLLADSHNPVNRWKSYFSRLLNLQDVSDVRQIEMHTAEPLVPGPSHLEVKIAIAKLKKYRSAGSDQIPAELIQAEGDTLASAAHKLVISIWNGEESHGQWQEPIDKKDDNTDCNSYRGISLL
jgi:hypothetical protein